MFSKLIFVVDRCRYRYYNYYYYYILYTNENILISKLIIYIRNSIENPSLYSH